jgi:hypothetical protein
MVQYNNQMISLSVLGCLVRIHCRNPRAAELICANYGEMLVSGSGSPDLEYEICGSQPGSSLCIARCGGESLLAESDGEFLFLLEKDLTIELQKIRRDLYFLHAAALGLSQRAFLIVAASGKGKSTTTWALLQHGFDYLSDELAPLTLDSLQVHPYPHALCLKKEPPFPYTLPDEALRTSLTLHVPTSQLFTPVNKKTMPVRAIFFLEYCPELTRPDAVILSQAEAAMRLFVNALNPLAHEEDGLAGAAAIAQQVPSFYLRSAELKLTCELIRGIFQQAVRNELCPRDMAESTL